MALEDGGYKKPTGVIPKTRITTIAGGAAGNHTLTGITKNDYLVSVQNLADAADLTSEFTITADDTINNTGGTSTASDILLIQWLDVDWLNDSPGFVPANSVT